MSPNLLQAEAGLLAANDGRRDARVLQRVAPATHSGPPSDAGNDPKHRAGVQTPAIVAVEGGCATRRAAPDRPLPGAGGTVGAR